MVKNTRLNKEAMNSRRSLHRMLQSEMWEQEQLSKMLSSEKEEDRDFARKELERIESERYKG